VSDINKKRLANLSMSKGVVEKESKCYKLKCTVIGSYSRSQIVIMAESEEVLLEYLRRVHKEIFDAELFQDAVVFSEKSLKESQ
jgi:hypothetical protein